MLLPVLVVFLVFGRYNLAGNAVPSLWAAFICSSSVRVDVTASRLRCRFPWQLGTGWLCLLYDDRTLEEPRHILFTTYLFALVAILFLDVGVAQI